jgi:putative PIN family toxin of toxin-antitoxin system
MKKKKYKIVIDTNVFISALKSKKGASFKLLFETSREKYDQCISTSLLFEYESVAKRTSNDIVLDESEIDTILDMICSWSIKNEIFFLWRPYLKDPKDDFILELAVESESKYIITYNKKDFAGIEKFGIRALTPKEFLKKIGEI